MSKPKQKSLMEIFHSRIKKEGFEVSFNPKGDGDCFFSAACFQMQQDAAKLKEATFKYLEANRFDEAQNDRLCFLCQKDFKDKVVPSDWGQALSKLRGEYATDMVISAFAEVMHHEITIISVHGPEDNCVQRIKPLSEICMGQIFVGHTGDGDHYVALTPQTKKSSSYADVVKSPMRSASSQINNNPGEVKSDIYADIVKSPIPQSSRKKIKERRKTPKIKASSEMEWFDEEEYNPGVPVWKGVPLVDLCSKSDDVTVITIDSSDSESLADLDRPPTKLRKTSISEKASSIEELTDLYGRLSSAENTPTKSRSADAPHNSTPKNLFTNDCSGREPIAEEIIIDDIKSECKDKITPHSISRDSVTSSRRYFKDDLSMPIFTQMKAGEDISVKEVAETILLTDPTSNAVCQKQPVGVQKNCCFLVNTRKLKDPADVRADDLGTWKHNGRRTAYVTVKRDTDGNAIEVEKCPKSFKPDKVDKDTYIVRRIYHTNGTNQDFKRKIVQMEDSKGDVLPVCVIKYSYEGEEKAFEPCPHKNAKGSEHASYLRTKRSTLDDLKEMAKSKTPKLAVEAVDAMQGGIMSAESAGSLPRNRGQVSNLRRQTASTEKRRKNVNGTRDELSAVMQMCMDQSRCPETAFVRKVQAAPDTMCILTTNEQLRELERNATDKQHFKVVSVDPTFNLGDFDVTVMTHEHGLVRSKRTGKHPIVMGPLLIHKRKQFANYHYLMSSLIEMRPSLSNIQAFGTDGEIALQQGLSKPCSSTPLLLRCFGHFKANCKDKLSQLGVPKESQMVFVRDIFGYDSGKTHYEGLVDSDGNEVFDAKLASLQDRWDSLEKQVTSTQVPSFHQWFCDYKADDVKAYMLPKVRTEAGLGSPPSAYYQNKSESINEVIKDQVVYKENELPDFIEKVKVMANRYEDLLRKAVARTGEWELLPGFRFLERPDWFKMTPKQREGHMKVVMKAELNEDRTLPRPLTSLPSTLSALSHGYDDIPDVATFTLKKIWREAGELVATEGYILPVPGASCPYARQVYNSRQPYKPCTVTLHPPRKNELGRNFLCDSGCSDFTFVKLCSHTVATAETNHVLAEYVEFLKNRNNTPNLHRLSSSVNPRRGAGRKGGQPSRTRNRTAREPVLGTTLPSNTAFAPTSTSGKAQPSSDQTNPAPQMSVYGGPFPSSQATSTPSMFLHEPFPLPTSNFRSVTTNSGSTSVPSTDVQQGSFPFLATSAGSSLFPNGSFQPPSQGQGNTASISRSEVLPGAIPIAPPTNASRTIYPSPSVGVYQIYLLKFCPGQVSKCFGCSGDLKPGGGIGQCPSDLTVVTKMRREYYSQNGDKSSKVSNVYFHCNTHCVRLKIPYFLPTFSYIPAFVAQYLLPCHFSYLRNNSFGTVVF